MNRVKHLMAMAALVTVLPTASVAAHHIDINQDVSGSAAIQADANATLKGDDHGQVQENGQSSSQANVNANSDADAHNNGKDGARLSDEENEHVSVGLISPLRQGFEGTVTAVGSGSFTLATEDGSFTVLVSGNTSIEASGNAIALADLQTSSKVTVIGTVSGNSIAADRVIVKPAHRVNIAGIVTAISSNGFTLETNHHGATSSVSVLTNASTTFHDEGEGTATTSAAVQVGFMVWVRGFWNAMLNAFNALRVKIQ